MIHKSFVQGLGGYMRSTEASFKGIDHTNLNHPLSGVIYLYISRNGKAMETKIFFRFRLRGNQFL